MARTKDIQDSTKTAIVTLRNERFTSSCEKNSQQMNVAFKNMHIT